MQAIGNAKDNDVKDDARDPGTLLPLECQQGLAGSWMRQLWSYVIYPIGFEEKRFLGLPGVYNPPPPISKDHPK